MIATLVVEGLVRQAATDRGHDADAVLNSDAGKRLVTWLCKNLDPSMTLQQALSAARSDAAWSAEGAAGECHARG